MIASLNQDHDRANLALRRGEWPLAEQMFRDLTRRRSDDAGLWLGLALALTLLGRPHDSKAAARLAVSLNPTDSNACAVLAQALIDTGQGPDRQAAVLAMVVRLAPSATQHARYADALFRSGFFDRALQHCDAALTLEPNQPLAQQTLDALRQAVDEAEKKFRHYLNFLGTDTRYPAPYAMFHGRPHERHSQGRLDAMGFRNTILPTVDKPPGEIRVFVLGDSAMFNGLNDDETVSGLLQKLLPSAGERRYVIYNFSMVSGCLGQMLSLLLTYLIKYKPDVVLVQAGAIDLFAPLTFDPRPGNPYNFYAQETLYDYYFSDVDKAKAGTVTRFSEIAKAIISRQASLRAACGWKTPAWEQSLIDNIADRIDGLHGLAAGFGFKAAFLLQPLIMFKNTLTASEAQIEVKDDFRDYMRRQYARLQDRLPFKDKADPAAPCSLLDYSGLFADEDADLHDDFIHYNLDGRRIVAACMRDIVLTLSGFTPQIDSDFTRSAPTNRASLSETEIP